jgi:RimJ/RimL family protein N-acetyltransferase
LQLSRLSNGKIYLHPYTLGAWALSVALLCLASGVLTTGDWPRGLLFSLSLVGGILIAGEWKTRTHFEDKATNVLKYDPTLKDVDRYYGKDRLLVATLGGTQVIGVIGILVDKRVGIVKHWHVNGQYRNRGLGWDLMEMGIKNAMGPKNTLQILECETYNLQTRAERSLTKNGFRRDGEEIPEPGILGRFGIKTRNWVKEF